MMKKVIFATGNEGKMKEIREILGEGISLREPEVSAFIKEYLESGKTDTDEGADI